MSKSAAPVTLRCAIYTRKSSEEGLEQEFNSLDAQREAGEAYIKSQQHEGWVCVPDRYDDGGFSGGNMDRPALQRLMADIHAGKVNCIVVYKVDRLSRSLIDFSKIMDALEQREVSFVSVTQQFNTNTSMGRLMLNVLLSFAQFEREIISERTRDKIAATRRKGKWSGGMPMLGYDVVVGGGKLLLNEAEARRVREIFRIYIERESLITTSAVLNDRGWTTKAWTTRKGKPMGGKSFHKGNLFTLLTNPIYVGKIRYKDELHAGEHPAIIDQETFDRARQIMNRNRRLGCSRIRDRYGALLRGLVRCVPCGCMMVATHSVKPKSDRTSRVYRYYHCMNAHRYGWHRCPSPSVPGRELERFVVDQIKSIGKDSTIVAEVLNQSRRQHEAAIATLEAERETVRRELHRCSTELQRALRERETGEAMTDHLASLQARTQIAERRMTEIGEQILARSSEVVSRIDVGDACSQFDALWETLTASEQSRILHLLIQRIDYDGVKGKVAITFHATGIRALASGIQ